MRSILLLQTRPPPTPTLFPYTTLFRSQPDGHQRAHDAQRRDAHARFSAGRPGTRDRGNVPRLPCARAAKVVITLRVRSEEHTSELQSHHDLVCRLLLEKKK